MATAPISAPNAATATPPLQLSDLLQVLVTELTHQDPFKPVDDTSFMAQIAQFASLDTTNQLNQNVSQLLALQAVNQSVGLLGRTVSATASDGSTINGTVIAITLSGSTPEMTIKDGSGNEIPNIAIGQLQTVRNPS